MTWLFSTTAFWGLVVNGLLGVVLQTAGLCRSPCVSALDAGENLLAALVQNTEAIWLLRQIHILEHGLSSHLRGVQIRHVLQDTIQGGVRVVAAADPEKLKREDHWSLLASAGDVSPPRSGEALLLIQKLELGQGDFLRFVCLGFGLHLLLTFLLHPLVDANGFRIACGGPGGLLTHPSILDKFGFGGAVVDQNSPRLTLQKRSRSPNDPAGPPQPNACDHLGLGVTGSS